MPPELEFVIVVRQQVNRATQRFVHVAIVRHVRFSRFARNGATCPNCRKLDTVRASFKMCKTHMTDDTGHEQASL